MTASASNEPRTPVTPARVLIVSEHASARFGGEAILPLHYFRLLRQRGVEAWLLVHDRTRSELESFLPQERDRMIFVPDRRLQIWLVRISGYLPRQLAGMTSGWASHLITQRQQKKIARRLVREQRINIVHEPMPVTPRLPSMMYGLGAAVIIGPMNGGMAYPPAYRHMAGRFERLIVPIGRFFAALANRLIPGKRRAACLLVANQRTRRALPVRSPRRVIELVENGVDLSLWQPIDWDARSPDAPIRFVFLGRLVDWKCVDVLIDAAAAAAERVPIELHIIGDGVERPGLADRAAKVADHLHTVFHGFVDQQQCPALLRTMDVLVLPSVYECGGAVVLEAMAMAMPVIATDWGGPADYLDPSCGVAVPPTERQSFVNAIADAMVNLAQSRDKRIEMGRAGRRRVEQHFDWQRKMDRILEVYAQVIADQQRESSPA